MLVRSAWQAQYFSSVSMLARRFSWQAKHVTWRRCCFDASQCQGSANMTHCQNGEKSCHGPHFVSCLKSGGSFAKAMCFGCEKIHLYKKNSRSQTMVEFQFQSKLDAGYPKSNEDSYSWIKEMFVVSEDMSSLRISHWKCGFHISKCPSNLEATFHQDFNLQFFSAVFSLVFSLVFEDTHHFPISFLLFFLQSFKTAITSAALQQPLMTRFQDSHHFSSLWWQCFLKRTLRSRFREEVREVSHEVLVLTLQTLKLGGRSRVLSRVTRIVESSWQ